MIQKALFNQLNTQLENVPCFVSPVIWIEDPRGKYSIYKVIKGMCPIEV